MQYLLLFCFFGFSLAAPFTSIKEIPEQYRSMVPQEAIDFLKGLTDADKVVLKDWAKRYSSYKNEHEAMQALKQRSPNLGEKAEKLHNLLQQKINSLAPEAKAFASEIIDRLRRLQAQIVAGEKPSMDDLKNKAALALKKYNALSPSAKAEFDSKFAILTAILKNDKFKKLAESFTGTLN